MFFLHPWLLLGLAVLAVPVLLHLFNRKRSRRVEWGAMLFLSASLALRRRRVMLEELLLMATRCLAVTLAALAFARPFAKAGGSVLWIVIALAGLVAVLGFAVLLTAGRAVKGDSRKKLAIGATALAVFAAAAVSAEGLAAWRRANRAGARDVVLLLDASGSMTLSSEGATNFERARKAAEDFILSSPRDTAFSVVLGGAVPEPLTPAPTTDRKQLLRLLDGAAPAQGTFNAPDGLAVAATSLAQGNNGNKMVVVFGDGQRQGWQPGANDVWACVRELFARFPVRPRVVWETLPVPEGLRNLTLSDIRFSRDVIGTDRPVRIDVTVVNNGAESATAAALSLRAEGRTYVDKAIGQLAPGESRTIAFRHRFARTGTHAVEARLDVTDDLPADDAATRVAAVRGPMEVLVVEGARGRRLADRPGAFIALALAPDGRTLEGPDAKKDDGRGKDAPPPPRFLVKPSLKAVADLADVPDFSAYPAIILADVPRIPSNTASRLIDYVERGGGLMVVNATRSRPDFYNDWKDADGAPFLPLALEGEAVTDKGMPADPRTLTHPALADLAGHGDLATAVFENYRRSAESRAAGVRVGGRLFDGTPLLADRQVRKGRVLQFAAALDPGSGNLVSRQSFLPMVHELVYFLARPIAPDLNLPPSGGASVVLSDGAPGPSAGEGAKGLRAVYYKGSGQDEVVAIRVDGQVRGNWRQDKIFEGFRDDDLFNVVWSGSLRVPRPGRYRIYARGNGKASIAFADDKARSGLLRAGVTVDLDASRRHDFRISCLDKIASGIELRWSCPGVVPDQAIPSEFLSPVRVTEKEWAETYPARVYRPGEAAPLAATLRYARDSLSLRLPRRLPPGVYAADVPAVFAPRLAELAALSNGYARVSFCVATDGSESRLGTILPDDKAFFSRFIDLVVVANEEELRRAVEGASVGRELWRHAAVPLLALLLLEILLTRWITERRRTGEEGHVAFDESARPGSRFQAILARMAAAGATRAPSRAGGGPSARCLLLPLALADLPAPRADLLPGSVPFPAIVAMALLALVLLVLAVRAAARLAAPAPPGATTSPLLRKAGHLLLPLFPAAAFAWALLQMLGRFASFGVTLPLWAMALVFGPGCAFIALAYRRERRVVPLRTGRALVLLRCLSYCIVAFMLLQPVFVTSLVRHVERTVAVVLDVSGSMRFQDTEWTDGERLSFARRAGWVEEKDIPLPSLEPMDALSAKLRPWTASGLANGRAPTAMRRLVSKTRRTARRLRDELGAHAVASSTNAVFRTFARQLGEEVLPAIEAVRDSPRDVRPADLRRLGDALAKLEPLYAPVRSAADALAWDRLPGDRRAGIVARTDTNRLSLAMALLFDKGRGGSFYDKLSSRYGVRFFALGRSVKPVATDAFVAPTNRASWDADAPWRTAPGRVAGDSDGTASDFAATLETLLAEVPSEELAGVLMLTDGIHNGDASVEPVARRYGARGVPVGTVLVGSSRAPFDLAIADISAPESVFLGDKVRVRATLSATRARGKTARVSLLKDGVKVDETTVAISDDPFRRDVSLSHAPGTNGLVRYELKIDGLEGERFSTNNAWKVDVAVSDDRTNVLLVDGYPRWEFRYLRNLFYARDKSVHLQYYLARPDMIEGIDVTNRLPPASASRPFGQAEAGGMPVSLEEWRKFDVVILGDVGPDVLTPAMQTNLAECVTGRGSLLVAIAGPRAMPHAFPADSPLADLMPVTWAKKEGDDPWLAPEPRFALELTQAGRIHPVMQQSSSPAENEQLWSSFPRFTWRYPFDSVKPAAEIIACAAPGETGDAPAGKAMTARNAMEQMEERRRRRERLAYIVAHNVGRGKVLALAGDETWRLRYRVGDVRHHRFWGQVIRWGLGERLRSGTRQLRVGTDRMTYTPHDPVRVLARVFTKDYDPVEKARLTASVAPAGPDGAPTNGPVLRVRLAHVPGSQGLYEAILPPRPEAGVYSVSIEKPGRYSGEPADRRVGTVFFVAASRRPIENAAVAATRETAGGLARWTGGAVLPPHRIREFAEAFGEPSRTLAEPIEVPLWDDWRLFALLAASLAAEWVLRKKRGLP